MKNLQLTPQQRTWDYAVTLLFVMQPFACGPFWLYASPSRTLAHRMQARRHPPPACATSGTVAVNSPLGSPLFEPAFVSVL